LFILTLLQTQFQCTLALCINNETKFILVNNISFQDSTNCFLIKVYFVSSTIACFMAWYTHLNIMLISMDISSKNCWFISFHWKPVFTLFHWKILTTVYMCLNWDHRLLQYLIGYFSTTTIPFLCDVTYMCMA
jgi:hypothetical protein